MIPLNELLPALEPDRDWTKCLERLQASHVHDAASLLFSTPHDNTEERRAQKLVESYFAADGETAAEAIDRDKSPDVRYSTGCLSFDTILDGGFRVGELIEISGSKSVGKTLLVLSIVLRALHADTSVSALFIDTQGNFSAERAYDVLARIAKPEAGALHELPPATPRTREAALDHVLGRLHVTHRASVPAVAEALSSAEAECEKANSTLRFIAIDTITPLFKDKLASATSAQGHASMTALARHLRTLASSAKHPLVVFLVNSSVSALPVAPLATFAGTKRKPALGPTWSHLTDWTIWLSSTQEMGIALPEADQPIDRLIAAEIWRSRRQSCSTWTPLVHDGLGLYDFESD